MAAVLGRLLSRLKAFAPSSLVARRQAGGGRRARATGGGGRGRGGNKAGGGGRNSRSRGGDHGNSRGGDHGSSRGGEYMDAILKLLTCGNTIALVNSHIEHNSEMIKKDQDHKTDIMKKDQEIQNLKTENRIEKIEVSVQSLRSHIFEGNTKDENPTSEWYYPGWP